MSEEQLDMQGNIDRMTDLLERLGAIALYLQTDMNHHEIARRLGMGTQRVNPILKGLKKPRGTQNGQ
jgi:DNA-binding transcriptional regulator LsrR (DeoR family)